MNNAQLINETLEEVKKDNSPQLLGRAQELTDIIEAIQNIGGSSYWNVLRKYVFDVDLDKAKRSLAKEKDTTEMFRLQGDIRTGEKLHLESLLTKYRNELTAINQSLYQNPHLYLDL